MDGWTGYKQCKFRGAREGRRKVNEIGDDVFYGQTVKFDNEEYKSGWWLGYDLCYLIGTPGCDNCHYESMHGPQSTVECGLHANNRLGVLPIKKREKHSRTMTAFDI